MMERDTGRSKGFGFVEMGSDAEAQASYQRHERPTVRRPQPGGERSPSDGSRVLPALVAAASAAAAVAVRWWRLAAAVVAAATAAVAVVAVVAPVAAAVVVTAVAVAATCFVRVILVALVFRFQTQGRNQAYGQLALIFVL
jgi:hypothetical protein